MRRGNRVKKDVSVNTSFTQSGLILRGRSTFDDPMEKGLVEGQEGFFGWML